jgi:hypothetical protein
VRILKKILALVIVFALLAVSLAVFSVAADNPKQIPVTFTRLGGSASASDKWYSGNTYHIRDGQVAYSNYRITGTGISLAGSSSSTFSANLNLKTGYGEQVYHITVQFPDGNFEGIVTFNGEFTISPLGLMAPVNAHFKAVMHGTDGYLGQTLLLEYDIVNKLTPNPLIGYLSIP